MINEIQVISIIVSIILSVGGAIVTVQIWAIKMAKAAGARGEREEIMKKDIDAIGKRVSEEIVPKVMENERRVDELAIRNQNSQELLTELRSDMKTVLGSIQEISVALASIGSAPRQKRA